MVGYRCGGKRESEASVLMLDLERK
jgi:hypothetical protein